MRSRSIGALIVLAMIIAGCSKSPEQLLTDAKESVAAKDHPTAIVELKNLLQVDPDNVEARLMLARSSLVVADPLSAEKELARAAELGASDGEFLAMHYRTQLTLGQHTRVLELLSDEQSSAGLSSAQVKQFRGEALLGLGSSIEAQTLFKEILAEEPSNAMALWGHAAALASRGATNDALDIARQLSIDQPDFARGWLIYGQLSLRSGRLDDAARDLQIAVDKAAATPDRIIEIIALASLADAQLGSRNVDGANFTIRRLAPLSGPTPITRLLIARLAIAQEDLTLASSELEQILIENPNNFQAMLLLASVHLAQHNYAQAEAYLQHVMAMHPQNLAARRLLAATQMKMNDPAAAVETLAPLLDDDDNDPGLSILASQVLLESGDPIRAIELLEQSLARDPGNDDMKLRLAAAFLAAGRFVDAQAMVESLPADIGFQRGIILAFALATQDAMEESQTVIDGVVSDYGDDATALILAADYYGRRGDPGQARELLVRAVSNAPTDTIALYELARIDFRAGNLDEAAENYEKVLAEDPNHVRAMSSLADISARNGNLDKSLELLDKAIAVDPEAATPRLMLAQAQLRSGAVMAAENSAHEAVRLAPENAAIVNAAAAVLLDTGKSREAQGLLSLAVQLRPEVSGYWYNLARAQSALGEQLESRKALEEAVRLDPASIRSGSALALMELGDGYPDKALAVVENVKRMNPDSRASLALEADVLSRMGRVDETYAIYVGLFAQQPTVQIAVKAYRAGRRAGLPDAHALLAAWVDDNPDDGSASMVLAQHFESTGDASRAIVLYEAAIAANGDNGIALNNLAWLYNEKDNPKAEPLARRAYALMPGNESVLDTLGWILVTNEKVTEGYQLLEEAVAKSPDSKSSQYHLAVASNKLNDTDRCVRILKGLLADDAPFGDRDAAEVLLAKLEQE